ncbi:MAG: DUF4162 domain-containing protein [Anaerolineae bacterium]|nr:DUF4162 domain-containing protein [Anaerolineae bacterium]
MSRKCCFWTNPPPGYLEEADELADRIAIIDGGKIAIEGTPEALKAGLGGEAINITFRDADTVQQAKANLGDLADRIQIDRNILSLYLKGAAGAVPAVVNRLQSADIELLSLTLTQPTLDDVFLQVTGQRLSADAVPETENEAAA